MYVGRVCDELVAEESLSGGAGQVENASDRMSRIDFRAQTRGRTLMTQSIVVIGNFDGVHCGHQSLLDRANELAAELAHGDDPLPVIAVTLWPHPMTVFAPDRQPRLLTTLDDRIDLLKRYGADQVRVVQFNGEVAAWAPSYFVDTIIRPLDPAAVIVGENFTFGKGASGTVDTLKQLADDQFIVEGLSLVSVGEKESSSSHIRKSLAAGDVSSAAKHLGRWFRLSGVVMMGDQRGRTLGFPTANLPISSDLATPGDGVYAGWLTVLDRPDAQPMASAISVGTNPTFAGIERRVETYVLDRTDLELYGVRIAIDFVKQLRGQMRFSSADELVAQMHHDVDETRQLLSDSSLLPQS